MTLIDKVNSIFLSLGAPKNLWGESLLSACDTLNRISCKVLNSIPYQLWNNRTPN